MSLTDAQKAATRRYLGYPDVNRESYREVEGALVALSADGVTIAVEILGRLATIQTDLASSWSRQKVVKAEEVTLAGAEEIRALRAEGRRLANELAALLGVTIVVDVFSGGSSSGVARRGA